MGALFDGASAGSPSGRGSGGFLGHPEEAIDAPLAERGSIFWETRWRFVQFLSQDLGSDFWPVLNDTFAALGFESAHPSATAVLSTALASRGWDFGTELGRFWGEHLRDGTVDGNGETPPYQPDRVVSLSSNEVRVSAPLYAADVGRIRLSSDVAQATVTASAVPDGGHLWVRLGDRAPEDITSPGSPRTWHFCVRGAAGDGQPWPGQMTFAYTNGGGFGPTSTGVVFTVDPSDEPCSRVPAACADAACGTARQLRRPPTFSGRGYHLLVRVLDNSVSSSDEFHEVVGRHCGPTPFGSWRFAAIFDQRHFDPSPGEIASVIEWRATISPRSGNSPMDFTSFRWTIDTAGTAPPDAESLQGVREDGGTVRYVARPRPHLVWGGPEGGLSWAAALTRFPTGRGC